MGRGRKLSEKDRKKCSLQRRSQYRSLSWITKTQRQQRAKIMIEDEFLNVESGKKFHFFPSKKRMSSGKPHRAPSNKGESPVLGDGIGTTRKKFKVQNIPNYK